MVRGDGTTAGTSSRAITFHTGRRKGGDKRGGTEREGEREGENRKTCEARL